MTPIELADLKSAAWTALRVFNHTGLASDADAASAAAHAVESAQEQYRVENHPTALQVFVLADADRGQDCQVWAVFPTGPECVYDAHAVKVAEVTR